MTAARNRHHRNKSIPYDRTVPVDRPDANNSRKNHTDRLDHHTSGIHQPIRLARNPSRLDQPADPGHDKPRKIP
ncbi:MAG TPA: hypothetical protein VN327_04535, partial [Pseudonocardiaceae bacterium]|nr:hypothetical protein [Pseudonocardiaceae bacterium]